MFDSSLGGLPVARAGLDQLPHESVLYLGDTARAPYGPRPIAEVRKFSLECLDFALWSAPHSRSPQVLPRMPGPARRPRGQDSCDRLQLCLGRDAARRPRAL